MGYSGNAVFGTDQQNFTEQNDCEHDNNNSVDDDNKNSVDYDNNNSVDYDCEAAKKMLPEASTIICESPKKLVGSAIVINELPSNNLLGSSAHEVKYETDGSMGWLVVAGSVFMVGSILSITPAFGILFSEKMRQQKFSQSTVSWIFAMHGVVFNVGVMVTNYFTARFSYRVTAFVTSLVLALSVMLLGLANSASHFFIIFGVLIPLSGGIASSVVYLLVPLHFTHRRGMAMGMVATGVSLGGIALPVLIRGLQDEFGYLGACLLHGALLLNCCGAACLFRTPKKCRISSVNGASDYKIMTEIARENVQHRPATVAKDITMVLWAKKTAAVCKNRIVFMTSCSLALIIVGVFNLLRIMPFVLEDHGHSKYFSAKCVSIWSTCSTASRVLTAVTSDQKWFNRRLSLLLGISFCAAATCSLIYLPQSQMVITAILMLHGFGQGMFMSLYHNMQIEVVGMERYLQALPIAALLLAALYGMYGAVAALLRHLTAWYGATIAVTAAMQTLCAILWCSIFRSVRRPS